MKDAFDSLKAAGCKIVYVDGSFVTSKHHPKDFDACWDPRGVNPKLLDSELLDFRNGRALQKSKYFGELFPTSMRDDSSGQIFLDFFQMDKENHKKKGIIAIELEELS